MRLGVILAVVLCVFQLNAAEPSGKSVAAQVKWAFGSDCDELLIDQIDGAKSELTVAIYSITHRDISKAFARAAKRGVSVKIKYDEEQSDWVGMQAALKILRDAKIPCEPIKMSDKHSHMHHKFTVIDNKIVMTGSFNYSVAGAKRNYENLIVISSRAAAASYKKEFEAIKSR